MMSRYSCVAIVSLSLLLPSVGFRVRPKKRDNTRSATSKVSGQASSRASPKVFTLGDSYSSGTGIHKSGNDYEGGDCWRDVRTTPGALLSSNSGVPFVNQACKGGVLTDVHQQFEQIKAVHPINVGAGFAGSTILFTIGGNDLRTNKGQTWPDLLTSCIMSFYGACHEKQENQIANWDDLQARATQFYTKLAQDAPNAKIRILGYPRLLMRKVFCIAVPLLNYAAADWADRQVDELNRRLRLAVDAVRSRFNPNALAQNTSEAGGQSLEDKLRQKATEKLNGTTAVSALETSLSRKGPAPAPPPPPPPPSSVDISFVDVSRYFSRGACRVLKREVNSIVLDGIKLSDSSFHPSQRGYNKYYEALANSVGMMMSASVPSPMDDLPDDEAFQLILEGWDTNKDNKIDLNECLAMAAPGADASSEIKEQGRAFFHQADKDKDGYLNLAEFEAFTALVEEAEEAAE